MNKLTEHRATNAKVKYNVKVRSTKDGLMRIEFWRPFSVLFPFFTATAEPSEVGAKIQQIQESLEKREAREAEIGRRLYGTE